MREDLVQRYDRLLEKVREVYQIFKDFFGEERVDLQGIPSLETLDTLNEDSMRRVLYNSEKFILVYYPEVRVTNEYDRYVDIQEVYIKVVIDLEGRIVGKFSINRAKYSALQFSNNYMHSHICDIPIGNFTAFQIPCTGSGPINRTICSLTHEFSEDLWGLFCLELDKFIHVESISGTPYHRLESLTNRRVDLRNQGYSSAYSSILLTNEFPNWPFSKDNLSDFILWVLYKGILKFMYNNGAYYLAMSPLEFYIKMSNCFIDWYNKRYNSSELVPMNQYVNLLAAGVIKKAKLIDGRIVLVGSGSSSRSIYDHIGEQICWFKGRCITLTALEENEEQGEDSNIIHMLHHNIANYILTKILNIINFDYGRTEETSPSEEEPVLFL